MQTVVNIPFHHVVTSQNTQRKYYNKLVYIIKEINQVALINGFVLSVRIYTPTEITNLDVKYYYSIQFTLRSVSEPTEYHEKFVSSVVPNSIFSKYLSADGNKEKDYKGCFSSILSLAIDRAAEAICTANFTSERLTQFSIRANSILSYSVETIATYPVPSSFYSEYSQILRTVFNIKVSEYNSNTYSRDSAKAITSFIEYITNKYSINAYLNTIEKQLISHAASSYTCADVFVYEFIESRKHAQRLNYF